MKEEFLMFNKESKQTFKNAIYLFAALNMILLMMFLFVLFNVNEFVETGAYIYLHVTFGVSILMAMYLIHVKNKIYKSEYRIKSIEHPINIPDSFKKLFRFLLPDGKQAFYSKHGMIPKAFVASVKGNKATLVEKLSEIDQYNHYKLLYLFKKKYALIEDIWCNKHLVHAEDIELSNMQ
jgi:hypothetical protein